MTTLDKDIVENAAKAGFKRLGDALKAAGLIGTYKGTGPFTFFAPTDEAFEKIPPGALRTLLENKAKLADILNAHVIAGEKLARHDLQASEAVSCQGRMLSIAANEAGFTVNGAKLLPDPIEASNGVIHAIDTVMMPGTTTEA
jgi:uncharacterized surface protein with fasciclin (FAS1) repeats